MAKSYVEFEILEFYAACQVGIAGHGANIANYVGQSAQSCGLTHTGSIVKNGATNPTNGPSFGAGSIIMIAVDTTAGLMYFGLNGVWAGLANPAAGTGAQVSGLGDISDWYPAASPRLYSSPESRNSVRILTGDSLNYTPPAGFDPVENSAYDPAYTHSRVTLSDSDTIATSHQNVAGMALGMSSLSQTQATEPESAPSVNNARGRASSIGTASASVAYSADSIDNARARTSSVGTASASVTYSSDGIDSARGRVSSVGTASAATAAAGVDSTRARASSIGTAAATSVVAGQPSTRARTSSTGTAAHTITAAGQSSTRARRSSVGQTNAGIPAINSARGRVSSVGTASPTISAEGIDSTRERRQPTGTALSRHAAAGIDSARERTSSTGTTDASVYVGAINSTRARQSSVGVTGVKAAGIPSTRRRRASRGSVVDVGARVAGFPAPYVIEVAA